MVHPPAALSPTPAGSVEPDTGADSGAGGHRWLAGAAGMGVVVPLVVAVGVLHDPRWVPMFDNAMIEMRVRDVGGGQTPLLGLGGRLRGFGVTGSHPGPLSFYALAPVYRVAGAGGWALLVAAAVASSVAAGLAVWLGHRRGGWPMAVVVGLVSGLLMRSYGAWRLVDPWNPHLPLAWWLVYLLAVWSLLCGDVAMLPVAVFAGSYCAQTHIPYVGLVVGLGLLAAGALVRQRRRDGVRSRRWTVWTAGSAGLALLLWLPPLVQQVTHHPGNLAVLLENFRHPYDERVSFGDAFDSWIRHLDAGQLLASGRVPDLWAPSGHPVAGALWLAAWATTAGLTLHALRRGGPDDTGASGRLSTATVARLHLVVAVAAGLGLLATARIFGPLYPYLVLWGWGTTALMVMAMACTLLLRWPTTIVPLGAAAAVVAVLFTIDAARTHTTVEPQQRQLAAVIDDTTAALGRDPLDCADRCRYRVTWDGSFDGTSEGLGLIDALRRRGYDAGPDPAVDRNFATGHAIDRDEADATVHVAATGDAIDRAHRRLRARQIAYRAPSADNTGHRQPTAVFLIPPTDREHRGASPGDRR
ncbi:MAG TPA: hypothetical protein VGO78_04980 [Acidimicrobiales bacterium]|nr:hypothetical protein [Acidimicrobiales bacterium]